METSGETEALSFKEEVGWWGGLPAQHSHEVGILAFTGEVWLPKCVCFLFVNSLEHCLTSSRLLLGSHQEVWLRRGRVREAGEGRDATSNAHRGQAGRRQGG